MQDVIGVMRAQGTPHLDLMIGRHMSPFNYVNAAGYQAGIYSDLEGVAQGRYRLLSAGLKEKRCCMGCRSGLLSLCPPGQRSHLWLTINGALEG
ncbi:hypothetical protein GCM10008955_39590 [Deinococcus malanensis]|uniref:Uncharacterized protein n=1 Tax=Deinococcus malanensis TaxID=1706855 RepID=A0ABQ2F566_9DEIO|nr:hypothetical protein GCM10008955_39590 [Deinococcus malanensis]